MGWAWTQNLAISGNRAVSGQFGTNLRSAPVRTAPAMGLFREGSTGTVAGLHQGEYTPVRVRLTDIENLAQPLPPVAAPQPLPDAAPLPPPAPIHDTTPGWAFTTALARAGGMATAGEYGLNLRDAPRRSGASLGYVPPGTSMIVTGNAQGEYTPVRVSDELLQPPLTAAPVTDPLVTPPVPDPDPAPVGRARIGLHASADPGISAAEIDEFSAARPGIIKLLSFHDPDGVRQLAATHPDASWIVRAFLSFGGRQISPQQFFNDTISDVERTLSLLPHDDVVIELHNEPNLVPEGMGASWTDGAAFAQWWLQLLALFRQQLPDRRFIFPGLSPGPSVKNLKMDHIEFLEASREAVKAADGLGVHIYWSDVYPMERALGVLDDYVNRFRQVPVWITEASNNKSGTAPFRKGMQYVEFWHALLQRPSVQGVTYFVASASDPQFAQEVWVGRGIGGVVGRR